MILPISYTEEHILGLQKISKRDPALLERTVYAFGLLESLVRVGMPFIFKGGTCLMLLLNRPQRLSTDIDIIVEPGMNLDDFIKTASEIFPFRSVEEQKRIGKNSIEKRHFKFIYESPINHRPLYILLDVLFEQNHYAEIITKEIRNELLQTQPKYLTVRIPSADCILADKLTAFAPHTTGIPLNEGKDMEVMKQFYDVTSLLDILSDTDKVRHTYMKIAEEALSYRGLDESIEKCLRDTFDAALCIASRGKFNADEYPFYVKGIRDLRGHIYAENYTPEIAAVKATKILYIIACLLTGTKYEQIKDSAAFANEKLMKDNLLSLSYLKKVSPEAYAYVVKADRLL